MSDRAEQIQAFLLTTEYAGAHLQPLVADASFRRYIRVTMGGKKAMLMDAPPARENVRPYVAIAEYLYQQGYSAPAILARDVEAGFLLLEDLGDDTFSRILNPLPALQKEQTEVKLYEAAIDLLALWHDARSGFANPSYLPLPEYNYALLLQEIQLFSDWYLPRVLGVEKAESLRMSYLQVWRDILALAPLTTDQFVHRDFHADNLMWLPERSGAKTIGLLDFQDAVYGDASYDIVSLLEDARRDVPPALVTQMITRYLQKTGVDAQCFDAAYHVLAAQRNSKIIGIFVRLAVRDGKETYLNLLPRVWAHLQRDVTHPLLAPLRIWLDTHVPLSIRGERV